MPEPHDPAAKGYTDREVAHLRELLLSEIRAVREEGKALVAASEKAVTVALDEQRAKWVVANEYRGTLDDYRQHTMPRPEIEGHFSGLEKDIDVLKAFMYAQQGSKTSLAAALGILLGLIGAGLAIYNTIRIPRP